MTAARDIIDQPNASATLPVFFKHYVPAKPLSQMSGPDGKINHAAMQLGADLIMMGYPGPKYKNPKRLGQATQMLYINVDDLDRHFQRAKKAGAQIIEEPKDTFYGHRRYGAEDPEGHQWYFAREIGKGSRRKKLRQPVS